MSITFGDFDPADAFDHEPPDPEQVARHLHQLERDYDGAGVDWDDLDPADRARRLAIIAALIHLLHDEGTGT